MLLVETNKKKKHMSIKKHNNKKTTYQILTTAKNIVKGGKSLKRLRRNTRESIPKRKGKIFDK